MKLIGGRRAVPHGPCPNLWFRAWFLLTLHHVSIPHGCSITTVCYWDTWKALWMFWRFSSETALPGWSFPQHTLQFSFSSSLLWFLFVTSCAWIVKHKQHLEQFLLQLCQGSLIYRARPFCVKCSAHSEEKDASCTADGKLPPKTLYFSLSKISEDKPQAAVSSAIALMHQMEQYLGGFLCWCLRMSSTTMW